MKKATLVFLISLFISTMASANIIEEIYGKNDLSLNNNYGRIYGSNFGSILELDNLAPRYIDLEEAETQINDLNLENDKLADEIKSRLNGVEEIKSRRTEIYRLLKEIDLILIDLRSTSAELYFVKNNTTDRVQKQKIQVGIEENRQQMYDLDNKKIELLENIQEMTIRMDESERFVTLNNLFIRKNNRQIEYIQECIRYSQSDTESISEVLAKSLSHQDDVDNILKISF